MNTSRSIPVRVLSIVLFTFMLSAGNVHAQKSKNSNSEQDDKTLSPYFFVNSDDPTDKMPLKSTAANVTISGVIADVEVMQVYKNEGKNTLEAIYIFPGSSRAAVYAMRMTIGKRTIEAKIQERQKARETYEKALKEGKTASLLEQQRPNVFQMNVGNILPGDEITVKMNYTELLVPENAVYEFVYPTVVGPRYSNQSESTAGSNDKWVANPYLQEGRNAPFTFTFSCRINSGIPIARLTSPSHEINSEYTGKNNAEITLAKSTKTGNRDVVLQYSLAGDKIESGLLLNIDKKEDFFLLMLEPPKRVETKMIVPREYIFIVDISGSMRGFPLDVTKSLMQDLLGNLRPGDFFNVMLFAGSNTVLSETSLPANKANLKKAIEVLTNQRGGGGTELMPALKSAIALPHAEENISRNMIIITDGYVSVEKDAFDYIAHNLDKGNVFSFGIGSSVNRFLIEGMARAGMGEPFIVLNQQEASVQAKKLKEYIDSPVLTDIKVDFGGLKTSEVVPVSIPDLFARKPVIVFGKYSGTPKGTITVTGKTAGKPYKKNIRVSQGKISTRNKALRYLWARHTIMRLSDYVKMTNDDKRIKEVTQLGLDYNLLTDYTSFVAVDNKVRTDGEPDESVKQPLPLPQGVSNSALGGAMPSSAPMRMLKESRRKPSVTRAQSVDAEVMKSNDKREELLRKIGSLEEKKHKITRSSANLIEPKARYERTHSISPFTLSIQISETDSTLDSLMVLQALQTQKPYFNSFFIKCRQVCTLSVILTIDATGNITHIAANSNSCCDKKFFREFKSFIRKLTFKKCGTGACTVRFDFTK